MRKVTWGLFIVFTAMSAGAAEIPPTASQLGLMKGFPPGTKSRIYLSNMLQPPNNRWSLQHLREFVPTREIVAGPETATINSRWQDLSALKVSFPDGRQVTVGKWLESAYTDGFAVVHRGELVYERYYNNQSAATQHLMFSVTKSFTGTMMLMLIEQGRVDGAASVSEYIPELAETAFGDATIQHLLDMTNSISYVEDYTNPESDIGRFLNAMMPGGEGLYSHLISLTGPNKKFKHGEAFHYVTPIPEVLGWIIRRVLLAGLPRHGDGRWRSDHNPSRCRPVWTNDIAGREVQWKAGGTC